MFNGLIDGPVKIYQDGVVIRRGDIRLHRPAWTDGTADGVRAHPREDAQPAPQEDKHRDRLVFEDPTGETRYGEAYETATWTSPLIRDSFAATELVPSWTADTPGGSFVRIELQGEHTGWYNLGNWSETGVRTSVAGQDDEHATVAADILTAKEGFAAWRARVTLLRPKGSDDRPVLRSLSVMASALHGQAQGSEPGPACAMILDVPRVSQKTHADGGGWCSPASVAMVLGYWGLSTDLEHAAEGTFDPAYGGCGNWPFNTAYAGRFGVNAFVTRLRGLHEAERFIAAGIPLIASAAYHESQVPGLSYDTHGHLMVIAGFTDGGELVLNDPAAPSHEQVRTTVGRREWESAWLATSRGIVYVIHPAGKRLPPPEAQANW